MAARTIPIHVCTYCVHKLGVFRQMKEILLSQRMEPIPLTPPLALTPLACLLPLSRATSPIAFVRRLPAQANNKRCATVLQPTQA